MEISVGTEKRAMKCAKDIFFSSKRLILCTKRDKRMQKNPRIFLLFMIFNNISDFEIFVDFSLFSNKNFNHQMRWFRLSARYVSNVRSNKSMEIVLLRFEQILIHNTVGKKFSQCTIKMFFSRFIYIQHTQTMHWYATLNTKGPG